MAANGGEDFVMAGFGAGFHVSSASPKEVAKFW